MTLRPLKKFPFGRKGSGTRLFIERMMNNPRQLGAVFPSSPHLGRLIANHVNIESKAPILELGGGTGALTKALIEAGVPEDHMYIVELDEELCKYLAQKFPGAHIIHGNAAELDKVLPAEVQGKLGAAVSGLPLLNIPKDIQAQIVQTAFQAMNRGGYILQYTYSPKPSLDADEYDLAVEHVGTVIRNVPPATVWKYSKKVE